MFLHHYRLNLIVLFVYLSLFTCWWSMVSARARRLSNSKLHIIEGAASRPGEWPFMAALFRKLNSKLDQFCGGVVWNDNTILTAAHCLNCHTGDEELAIYLGHTDISQLDSNYLFGKLNCKYAPGYYYGHNKISLNDLALIRLDRSIDFGGRHSLVSRVGKPVSLDLLDTANCITMGWGSTSVMYLSENVTNPHAKRSNILLELKMTVHGEKHCAREQGAYNSSLLVCASNPPGSPCSGDSGGPLLCPLLSDPTRYSLVGIASFGSITAGYSTYPFYYTKAVYYLNWIEYKLAHWDSESDGWWGSIVWEHILDNFALVLFVAGVVALVYCCVWRVWAAQQR